MAALLLAMVGCRLAASDAAADCESTVRAYADADGDGYGDPTVTMLACEPPAAWVSDGTDCDDADPARHPEEGPAVCADGEGACGPHPCRFRGSLDVRDVQAGSWVSGPTVRYLSNVTPVGDVTLDGLADLIVHDLVYSGFHGGEMLPDTAVAELYSTDENHFFVGHGEAGVVAIGDVDGNDIDDVIVSGQDTRNTVAWLVAGPLNGRVDVSAQGQQLAPGMWVLSAARAGDGDGDGFADVVVGVLPPEMGRGAAFVFRGSSNGIGADPAAELWNAPAREGAESNDPALAGDCDLDGDGRIDVVSTDSMYDEVRGRVYVVPGDFTGVASAEDAATAVVDGVEFSGAAGIDVDVAGDVDGDGYDDLLVGHLTRVGHSSLPDLYTAATLVAGPVRSGNLADATATFRVADGAAASLWGAEVRGLGDLDQDGLDDFAIGTDRSGDVFLYYGGRTGAQELTDADARLHRNNDYQLGHVIEAGDLDQDGYRDLILADGMLDRVWYVRGNEL